MILRCAGSGSDGNCYALTDDKGKTLFIEAGVSYIDMVKMLDWDIRGVVGCIVSHQHSDHARSASKLEKVGIPCFKPYEEDTRIVQYGSYTIRAFELTDSEGRPAHTNGDGTDCPIYGFKIVNPEMGTMIYLTDCKFCRYSFKTHKVNHFLLGVNYQEEYLPYDEAKRYHVVSGHMSEKTAIELINANRTDDLQNIILGHLSEGSCNADTLLEHVTKSAGTGVQTHVAVKDAVIKLHKDCPF